MNAVILNHPAKGAAIANWSGALWDRKHESPDLWPKRMGDLIFEITNVARTSLKVTIGVQKFAADSGMRRQTANELFATLEEWGFLVKVAEYSKAGNKPAEYRISVPSHLTVRFEAWIDGPKKREPRKAEKPKAAQTPPASTKKKAPVKAAALPERKMPVDPWAPKDDFVDPFGPKETSPDPFSEFNEYTANHPWNDEPETAPAATTATVEEEPMDDWLAELKAEGENQPEDPFKAMFD